MPGPAGMADPTRDARAAAEFDSRVSEVIPEPVQRTVGALPWTGSAWTLASTGSDIVQGVQMGEGGLEGDIPTATGEGQAFDTVYDATFDQPSYAEDDIDLPGPTLDVVAQEGREFVEDPRQYGPDWLDELTGVALFLGLILVLGWVLRPGFQIVANLSEAG